MLLVDIILILILIAFMGRGWRNGFIDSLGELIGAIIAFLAARAWSLPLASPISTFMPENPGLARLIAFIVIFLIVVKLIGWIFGMVAKLLKIVTSLPLISSANKILGSILGFLTGFVFVGSTVYLVLTFRLDDRLVRWLAGSTVALYTEKVFSSLLRFLI